MTNPRVALIIVDGIGLAPGSPGNVVKPKNLPTLFDAMESHGHAVLEASGPPVGLYEGQVGNSEVGHLTIGAGRLLPSMLKRIDDAFEDESWARHSAWPEIAHAGCLHIVGLLSDAGVHAHWSTIVKAARLARDTGIADVVVHPILDGFDCGMGRAGEILDELTNSLPEGARLGVVMGRKWFCDRSGDLSVTARFVDAVREGSSPLPVYARSILDEHMRCGNEMDFPAHLAPGGDRMRLGDPVIHTSHRADRAVQAVEMLALTQPVYTMTSVADEELVPQGQVFLPVVPIEGGIADVLAAHDVRSTRIAEICKFPHVTYFFNGYRQCVGNEQQIEVAASEPDLVRHPEMSIVSVTEAAEATLADDGIGLTVVNLANLDQVGHIGNLEAARSAADAVEAALARIVSIAARHGVTLVLMSDHGNADRIVDAEGQPFVGHTEMPVPFTVLPSAGVTFRWRRRAGSLIDVAPSLLALLGLPVPKTMGEPLIELLFKPANAPLVSRSDTSVLREGALRGID